MSGIYKIYRNRLIEISGKSRSLYSKNAGGKKQAYNLGKLLEHSADAARFVRFLKGESRSFKILEGHFVEQHCKDMTPVQKKRALESEVNSLRALKREIESIEQETGRYELFLGYPFVEGGLGGGVLAKAPLVLYPVRLLLDSAPEIELIAGEPILLNKVLLLAYAKENRVNIEELDMEFGGSDSGDNFLAVDKIVSYLGKQGITLKLPRQSAVLDIEKAQQFTAKDALTVRNFAVLGRFPLANSIYYDYIQMEKKRLTSPALDAILNNKEPKFRDKKPEEYYPIHQPDYSQEKSLEFIGKYNNAVIHGPPGTGKSQTITNIISDALCKNKRVLVVSQKRTALDVIFNRLGNINSKVMILPDPEKSKSEFYDRARSRYAEALEYKNVFDPKKLETVEKNLAAEYADLRLISDTLFSKLPFGLSLQQMYLKSARLGKNAFDYNIYAAMQQSRIIKMGYGELAAALDDIQEKNKGQLFYKHYHLVRENPIIDYIKSGLDLDRVNRIKTYVHELMASNTPFNFAKSPYSRILMSYNVESGMSKNYKPLADMISRLENPKLYKRTRASGVFPLLWVAYPFFKARQIKARRRVNQQLAESQILIKDYISGFSLLEEALYPDGLAMIVNSIANGSTVFLKKFAQALDDYLKLKDIKNTVKTLDAVQLLLLEFAFENSRGEREFLAVLGNILSIRIYHELIHEEKSKEVSLSKLITFDDIRNKIVCQSKQKMQLAAQKAMDEFNDEFKTKIRQDHEKNKNFLHQINKQSKLWPVRRLFEHFEDFLFDLFPCWLLSPEAVSAILPLKPDLFDYVIFDEASQIFIEHTIPTIYRGKHLVVAGDNKQLRPTSVFIKRYMGDDTYVPESELSAQAAVEVESLLDLATSRLKEAHLTYHYRSKYEELINFSNYAFYGGRLQIAPNSSRYKGYLPIERIKVNGKWIDRKNITEAQEVARLVARLLKTRKNNESIGIVTFNTEQQECIEDTLDRLCEKDSVLKTLYLKEKNRREDGQYNGIFVKNLENVQGDERDIMIFSTAYAKNEDGRLTAQFGTLSMSGGENRLNVAVTRAREKIYLVTSVEPEEFTTIESSKNAGPKLFKKYLEYARAVSQRDYATTALLLESLRQVKPLKHETEADGLFEQSLKQELEKTGLLIETNLGGADYKLPLAVYDKQLDRYILGLECDYSAFNSSESVLERDVYRNSFLESRGWKIMRIWSRDWWINKDALIKRIKRIAEEQKQYLLDSGARAKSKAKNRAKPEYSTGSTSPRQQELSLVKPRVKPVASPPTTTAATKSTAKLHAKAEAGFEAKITDRPITKKTKIKFEPLPRDKM